MTINKTKTHPNSIAMLMAGIAIFATSVDVTAKNMQTAPIIASTGQPLVNQNEEQTLHVPQTALAVNGGPSATSGQSAILTPSTGSFDPTSATETDISDFAELESSGDTVDSGPVNVDGLYEIEVDSWGSTSSCVLVDLNSDGLISPREDQCGVAHYANLLEHFDVDADTFLDRDEWTAAIIMHHVNTLIGGTINDLNAYLADLGINPRDQIDLELAESVLADFE